MRIHDPAKTTREIDPIMKIDNIYPAWGNPTQRMQGVQSPIIPVVGELIRENPGTISLGQGVVNYGPPPETFSEIQSFLLKPENHKYGMVQGISRLLDALEVKLKRQNNIMVQPDSRIVVTAGANMGFVNAILAICDPGDEVILLLPYYFNHDMALAIADCKAVCVPTDADYQPLIEKVQAAISSRTRAIVTISPNNPTGAVYSSQVLCKINNLCREKGLYHISDEAYEDFTYNGVHHFSPGSIADSAVHTISLFSFSKAYGFASWRVGYMVVPEHLFPAIRKIQDTILICPPVISQWAACGALMASPDYLQEKVRLLSEVRGSVLQQLEGIGECITVPQTQGAFYFLVHVHTSMSAMDVVKHLVREHRVAVIPGDTFGIQNGCYLRVAYGALDRDTVDEGVGRLVAGLNEIARRFPG